MVIDKIVFEDEIFVIIKNDNNYTCTCGSKDCNHIAIFKIYAQNVIDKRILNEGKPLSNNKPENVKITIDNITGNVTIFDNEDYSCDCKQFNSKLACVHVEQIKINRNQMSMSKTRFLKTKIRSRIIEEPVTPKITIKNDIID